MTTFARMPRATRYLITVAAMSVAALGAGALPASAAPIPTTGAAVVPHALATTTGCTHNALGIKLTCISVLGDALFVGSATVTNMNLEPGVAKIINTGDGVVHTGPKISAGGAYTVNFERDLKNGAQICGQIASNARACVTIHS
jgi:hypothetical protein